MYFPNLAEYLRKMPEFLPKLIDYKHRESLTVVKVFVLVVKIHCKPQLYSLLHLRRCYVLDSKSIGKVIYFVAVKQCRYYTHFLSPRVDDYLAHLPRTALKSLDICPQTGVFTFKVKYPCLESAHLLCGTLAGIRGQILIAYPPFNPCHPYHPYIPSNAAHAAESYNKNIAYRPSRGHIP